jgi:hypothetical protein
MKVIGQMECPKCKNVVCVAVNEGAPFIVTHGEKDQCSAGNLVVSSGEFTLVQTNSVRRLLEVEVDQLFK